MNDITEYRPKKKIRLTSLFFTIGLLLMAINLFMEATKILMNLQAHTLGGAIATLGASIIAQFKEA